MSSLNHNSTQLHIASVLALIFFTLSTCPVGPLLAAARASETEQPTHRQPEAISVAASDPGQEENDSGASEGLETAGEDPAAGDDEEPSDEAPPADEDPVEEKEAEPGETKKGGGWWKYVLGGVVIVAGAIVLLVSGDGDEPGPSEEPLPEFPDPPEDGK